MQPERSAFLVPTFHVGMQPARSGVPEGQQRIENKPNLGLGACVAAQFFCGRETKMNCAKNEGG
jgi:hypothetical protein